jgi:hypothetical protein
MDGIDLVIAYAEILPREAERYALSKNRLIWLEMDFLKSRKRGNPALSLPYIP